MAWMEVSADAKNLQYQILIFGASALGVQGVRSTARRSLPPGGAVHVLRGEGVRRTSPLYPTAEQSWVGLLWDKQFCGLEPMATGPWLGSVAKCAAACG